ncbi:PREDICTED: fas apoptotic inhibitory molecule 3 [Elephantulus edwardii]|uniref:fas apoptotic inhibitory molecule 3 n=1 Tax=Elephantulus edwardii TaxID=28737 RepID=UPI0003F0D904|nr:PREDICTED: fas apoptotic inhibitory molecule 3 [Elephantulus edwardii]
MNLWLWWLHFLPVVGARKKLPEVNLEGELGGSITFKCPLPETYPRIYLCREVSESGMCATVVSNKYYVKNEYIGRVTLKLCPEENVFLVEITEVTEDDSGVYACGAGFNTDQGKTLKITLSISVTKAAGRTQAPPVYHTHPDLSLMNRPLSPKPSSVAADKPPTLLPSTTASTTPAQEEKARPQLPSYDHQTRLHRHRDFNYGSSVYEDHGFHILIPTFLGLMLLALLGLVVKRAIQRRKVLSRKVRRLAMRMRASEASQRPRSLQRPRVSRQQRSQNIYSACPHRARGAEAPGPAQDPAVPTGAQPSAPTQVLEAPWAHASPLTTSCEYESCQPPAKTEDADSDDYVNVPHLTHLPSYPPESGPLC